MANAYHCLNYAMVTLTALTTVQMKENVIVSTYIYNVPYSFIKYRCMFGVGKNIINKVDRIKARFRTLKTVLIKGK